MFESMAWVFGGLMLLACAFTAGMLFAGILIDRKPLPTFREVVDNTLRERGDELAASVRKNNALLRDADEAPNMWSADMQRAWRDANPLAARLLEADERHDIMDPKGSEHESKS